MRRRRSLSTLIYALIVLGMFCYIVFFDGKVAGTKQSEEDAARLLDWTKIDPVGLDLTNPNGTYLFRKEGENWVIKSPIKTLADRAAVEQVFDQLRVVQVQRNIPVDDSTPEGASNLQHWGLSNPEETLIVHSADGKEYKIFIGRNLAISDSVYSRVSGRGQPVKIIPSDIKAVVSKDISAFRSRSIFDFPTDDVVSISSETRDASGKTLSSYEVAFKEDQWTLQKPLVARAQNSAVANLIGQILALHVVDFVTDSPGNFMSFGLAPAQATLTVKLKNGDSQVLHLGGTEAGRPDMIYGLRDSSNTIFSVSRSSADDILTALPNVRDRHILPFEPIWVHRISYKFAGREVALVKHKDVWNLASDEEALADGAKTFETIRQLVSLLTTPKVIDAPTDLKLYGLDKPQGQVTLGVHDPRKGDSTCELAIGSENGGLLYVRSSLEPFIYTVPKNAFDFLPKNDLEMRDGRAMDVTLSKVSGLSVTRPDGKTLALLRSPGGTWSLPGSKTLMVDSTQTEGLASLLCQLRAKTWLGPVLPAYGLTKPSWKFALKMIDGPGPVLLLGTHLADGSVPALIAGTKTAFSIEEGDDALLTGNVLRPIPTELNSPLVNQNTGAAHP